jgi:YVTN family beta-propeller protein
MTCFNLGMGRWTAVMVALASCLVFTSCGSGDDDSATDTSLVDTLVPEPTDATVPAISEPAASSPATEPDVTEIPATTVAPATSTTVAALPDPLDVADIAGVQAITAEPFPDWVTIADGAAWVANVGSGVVGYDLTTAAPIFDVPTGVEICLAMDSSPGSLWVGACDTTTLYRVNTADGVIAATILLPFDSIAEESSIAANDDSVWVMSAGPDRQIAQISVADNSIVTTFAAPDGASAMRFLEGSLWVSDDVGGVVHRVDPTTGQEQALIEVDDGARFMAVGEGGLWVMNNGAGTVSSIDPASNSVTATIVVSITPVTGGDIAVGGGFVWARVGAVLVAQIDPSANAVVARFGPHAGSGSVAADDDAVWISAHDVLKVWRVPISD